MTAQHPTLSRLTPDPRWIASAAVTVLCAAAVAAVTLVSTPVSAAAPATEQAEPAPAGRLVATSLTAPVPVVLSFPAPVAQPAVAPARPATPAGRPAPTARRVDPMCAGAGWEQRRGEATVTRLRRPADARAVPVAFQSARSDILGMADLRSRRVDVFVRSCAQESGDLLLHVLAHELGHVLDATRMDGELRARWMERRGIPADTPWFGCDRCADFATPAGDFAEAYAQWQRGASSSRSQLAPAPSRAQLNELAEAFFPPL